MEIWNGTEWVEVTEEEAAWRSGWAPHPDEAEDNPQDLDDVVDKMMTDPDYYDRVVGWF